MTTIVFANPKKQKMAAGWESLELTEAGTWESFPPFAHRYAEQIGAKVLRKITGPDMHIWEIEYEGEILNFVYDDFPNGVSIEPKAESGQLAIDKLYRLVLEQSDPNGL
ncbi:DUF3630 family protein [Parahaliea mediterranea]|uniref:DUF3630 family protein n=1 Tax=Parahaliea mediterranea TaxID=651086 RepID=A0A939DJZ4_9GAMM|nr:DUF3630 family protein [Parahaliea mediterranea]MBN7799196.1 DUF3630 family protein [Parahaliea mediterranea]